jgi:hypothetical protein
MRALRTAGASCCLAILMLAWAQPAHANQCQSEIKKFCEGKTPIIDCLRANSRDLSPGCTTYLGIFERIPSCVADARRLCPSKNPSVAGVHGCLQKKKSQLSEACHKELADLR